MKHRLGKFWKLEALGCAKVNLQIWTDITKIASFDKTIEFDVEERLSREKKNIMTQARQGKI
jgi:hypothetical protein